MTALEESIVKWKARQGGEHSSPGWRDCPLCLEHYKRVCGGCPIFEATGEDGCSGTPVDDYHQALQDEEFEEAARLAGEMVEFMESLK